MCTCIISYSYLCIYLYEVMREKGEASKRAVPVTFDEISEVRVHIYIDANMTYLYIPV